MHARRNSGNGFRSNSMGMAVAASRASPEGSTRSHGSYNSEYRSFNREFVRSQSKLYQPPQVPRRADIFMEAGRLAAEYLVSKGMLPPAVLSTRWQSSGEFKAQERDNLQLPSEGRMSALARLGSTSVADVRKRSPDGKSRNDSRERRRVDSFMSDGDVSVVADKDLRNCSDATCLTKLEKQKPPDDIGGVSEANDLSPVKDLPLERGTVTRGSNGLKDCVDNDETNKQNVSEEVKVVEEEEEEGDSLKKSSTDLLKFCQFGKIPTKARSVLTCRSSKFSAKSEEEKAFDVGPSQQLEQEPPPLDSASVEGFTGNELSNQTNYETTVVCAQSEGPGELGLAFEDADREKCVSSQSFPDSSFVYEQELSQGPPGFGESTYMVKEERGEKRAAEPSESGEVTKKHKEWLSNDDSFQLSNMEGKDHPNFQASHSGEVIVSVDNESPSDLFLKNETGQSVEYTEEKQFFPSSFKICDLNLMEASDMNESHDTDAILNFPTILETKREDDLRPLDIDLSISNDHNIGDNHNMADKQHRHASSGKEVEVIDLEDDPIQEDKGFNSSERRTETVYTGLESFQNHPQSTNELPGVQDGYGLMISELLGNDISNCSSVPADITSLHNEMGLHNAEGILGDDDPIYMSLGEIPISFMHAWERPAQEYEKPF